MKVNHAVVFGLVIVGIAFLAYKNMAGMSGMFYKDSMGSALGGPVYSSQKARISIDKLGAQPSSVTYGPSRQVLSSNIHRLQRGA